MSTFDPPIFVIDNRRGDLKIIDDVDKNEEKNLLLNEDASLKILVDE